MKSVYCHHKEHPNFKSFDNSMPDIVGLFDVTLASSINNTPTFYKQCPPWEVGEWEERELMDFKIEVEKIDRLYLVNFSILPNYEFKGIESFCRMDYKGRSLYFHLQIRIYFGSHCPYQAELYLTFNAEVFVKAVVGEGCDRQKIWKSMIEDGVVMKNASSWENNYSFTPRVMEYGFPTLEYLCHLAIFNNLKELNHYPEVLPYCMTKSVDQNIKIWKTQDHRDSDKYDIDETDTHSDINNDVVFEDDHDLPGTRSDDSDKYDIDETDTHSDINNDSVFKDEDDHDLPGTRSDDSENSEDHYLYI